MQEVDTCPKGHGPLRRDDEGLAVCIVCGYVQPPKRLPVEDPDKGMYADKFVKPIRYERQGYKYPESIKIEAVIDLEKGVSRKEVLDRVGCCPGTLKSWESKYSKRQLEPL